MNRSKVFLELIIFFLLIIVSFIAESPKVLAYSGSASADGGSWDTIHTPNPVTGFTVTSAADALSYKKVDLSLHTGQGTTTYIYLNGTQLVTWREPNGIGGYHDETWTNFDLTTVMGPLVIGTTYNFSCVTDNWSGTGYNNTCSVSQTPECISFTVSDSSISTGESTILNWVTANASSISFNPVIPGPFTLPNGNVSITPPSAGVYTYKLTINGIITGGIACPPVSITVVDPIPSPIPSPIPTPVPSPFKPVKLSVRPMKDIVVGLINVLLGMSAGLAVLFIIYGGIRYITAFGNEAKIEYSKRIVTYAVLGLFIICISFVIVKTIASTILD